MQTPLPLSTRRLCLAVLDLVTPLAGPSSTASAADITGQYTFKPIKIGGGGFVTGLVTHPTTANLTYCRTDVGGAFRWNASDGGWVRLTTGSGMPAAFRVWQYYNVEAIAADKLNDQIVYHAAGAQNPRSSVTPAGAIFKSTNRGATWTFAGTQRWKIAGNDDDREGGERLAVDPANSSVVY
ncbi:MAG: sialidase, partial [Burkholderiales bacterium]|nr:sialidase [Opitutaceae bacterium]